MIDRIVTGFLQSACITLIHNDELAAKQKHYVDMLSRSHNEAATNCLDYFEQYIQFNMKDDDIVRMIPKWIMIN
jgi:hypothetical protein